MSNYPEARVKWKNAQLNKFKSATKNKTGTISRINKKNIQNEELPHELFPTAKQITKLRTAIAKNMSTETKLSKALLSKMIQSGGFLRNKLGNLGKKK